MSCRARATASEPTPSAVSAGASEMPSASLTSTAMMARPTIHVTALPMPDDERSSGLERPNASIALKATRISTATPSIAISTATSRCASVRCSASSGRKRTPAHAATRNTAMPAGRGRLAASTSVHSLRRDAATAASDRRRTPRTRMPTSAHSASA